ncbi:MAG TPA: sigma-70 family RNA polymerase sigma factor [Saprospiraceae bacterium]|nr:sigma-70 family RNA polymerase sigma factor [Saprospiraceae bacterium]
MDEIQLMIQVSQGDLAKLGILYERYKQSLFGYFYRVTCGDHAFSEDMVHQVFVRVLKYRSSFKGTGSFAKWVFHIAHHIAVDYSKSFRHYAGPDSLAIKPSGEPDPYKSLEQQEKIILLNRALSRLKEDDREAVTLAKIQGLKYQDIAAILDTTEGAVRVKIHRALIELKKIYSHLEST